MSSVWRPLATLGGHFRPTVTKWTHRSYWWGHKTIEEKELEKQMKKEMEVIKWTDPQTGVTSSSKEQYTPARIYSEADALSNGYSSTRLNPADMMGFLRKPRLAVFKDFSYWITEKQKDIYKSMIKSQMFMRDRVLHLGPDLAAAHFLCHRQCRVRFKGHLQWTELDKYRKLDIPESYEPGWYIEAIDAAESDLIYEGFQNLRNLIYLQYLDLSYSPNIDAFCLDRITGEYQDSLEYLDLSGCVSVDWNAIECLWRLRQLKTLVLYDMDHIKDLPLLCILLLDIMPHLDIRGVDYIDVKLLEGKEEYRLLSELDDLQLLLPAGDEVRASDANKADLRPPEEKEDTAVRDQLRKQS